MKVVVNPEKRDWARYTSRSLSDDAKVGEVVREILRQVREKGDTALKELNFEIDKVRTERLELTPDVIRSAGDAVAPPLKDAIAVAYRNILKFHEAQKPETVRVLTSEGVTCIQKPVPVNRAGLYIPGGSAPLFSTVLMLAIPAKVAGCPEVILCTPPSRSGLPAPEILYAASVCGIDRIFMCGGAQAIAAMAYGTESIPRVDKIFGPGNRYVTAAKQMVWVGSTAIDMPAGPSEVMVLADGTADASFVASDLLSQAEHGPDSQAMLVCTSRAFAQQVENEIEAQLGSLPRGVTARQALDNGYIVVMDDTGDMIGFANEYAAEHLIISMEEPWRVCDRITNAGSIFIGNYSPESAGDYASGTNHTLPTAGWARSFSGVNVDSFMKKITIQELTRQGLAGLGETVIRMAEAEGLQAHANAVRTRLK